MALECDELYKAVDLKVTSTCEGEVTVTKKDLDASGGCVGTIIRKWTIKDACGNKKLVEQLNNTNKFHDYIDEKQSEYEIVNKSGYSYIKIDNNMVLAWNKTTAIYVAYEYGRDDIEEKAEEIITLSPNSQNLYNSNSSAINIKIYEEQYS